MKRAILALVLGCQAEAAAPLPQPAPEPAPCTVCDKCVVSSSQVTGAEGAIYLYLQSSAGAALSGIMTSPERCAIVAKYMNTHLEPGMLFGCWNSSEVLKGLP